MRTVWGLFIGDKLIKTSVRRKELIPFRDSPELKKQYAYISVWLGRIDLNTMKTINNDEEEEISNEKD